MNTGKGFFGELTSGPFTGSLRSTDPDRVVLKKVVLTGFPVKVHKMKAVVRWMFHSPEDVRWFRPLDLFTKYGRRGRIKVKPCLLSHNMY